MRTCTDDSTLLLLVLISLVDAGPGFAESQAAEPTPTSLHLALRRQEPTTDTPTPSRWESRVEQQSWDPKRTAAIVCDMWDRHWCHGATTRVSQLAPRINQLLNHLRERGVLIIHCPSDTLKSYETHPGRALAANAPKIDLKAIQSRYPHRAPAQEPSLPIDDSDGGCDDQPPCSQGNPWRRQIATIEIQDRDAITDSVEAFYLMHQRGVTNVLIMGVHQNMCVLGRPFAIRQLVRLGQNVALVRDLTDSMYNSRRKPFVNHFEGNDLVCQHIERYWCPTVTSDQFLGGLPFRFPGDHRPRP